MEHTHTHTGDEHNHAHHTNPGEHHENHSHGSGHHEAKAKMMGHAGALEAWLAPIFAQAPHIPAGGRKVITDIIPWLSLIFGILGLVALVSAGALGALFSPLMLLGAGFSSLMFFVHIILGLISSALGIMAFNPLKEMKKRGWDYSFYSLIIGAISALVTLLTMSYGGLNNIIGIVIGAYLLFEIREMYHK